MTVLMALSSIASEQTKGTKRTLEKAYQVLDYLASHLDAVVRLRASDMVLNIKCTQQSVWAFFHGCITN